MLNSINIHGRLVADPDFNQTQSGVSVCKLRVAVDRSYAKQGEEKITDFFDVTAWRGLADMLDRYFTKGKEIVIHGSMQSRKWQDKDGNNRISWEVLADSVDFCGSKSDGAQSSGGSGSYTPAAKSANIDVENDEGFTSVPEDKDLPF